MAHTKFEMEFELAAQAAERCREDWCDSDPEPELALRALKIMFANRRESVLEWQARRIAHLRLRNRMQRKYCAEILLVETRATDYWEQRFYDELRDAREMREMARQASGTDEARSRGSPGESGASIN